MATHQNSRIRDPILVTIASFKHAFARRDQDSTDWTEVHNAAERMVETWPTTHDGTISLCLVVYEYELEHGAAIWPRQAGDQSFACRMLAHVGCSLIRLRTALASDGRASCS